MKSTTKVHDTSIATTTAPMRAGGQCLQVIAALSFPSLQSSPSSTPTAVAPSRARDEPQRPKIHSVSTGGVNQQLSFTQAFGVLGLPMLLVVVVCIAWTSWLIFLACAPAWTANHLMNTSEFEDGNFWFIVDAELPIKVLSLIGQALVLLGYIYVLVKILVWRNSVSSFPISFRHRIESNERLRKLIACRLRLWRPARVLAAWHDLTGFSGSKRKFWNIWLKSIDLTLQTISLVQMLRTGFPQILAYSYAALVAANSLSCVATVVGRKHSAFLEVLVDSIFDLLFAVAMPIVVLAYCYSNFDYDRQALAINMEVFPNGAFERQARMLANPSEIFLFRTSFDSLRILSATDFVLRIGMNLSLCYRFKRVVEVQVARRKHSLSVGRRRSHSMILAAEMHVPRCVALVFALFAALVLVGTHEAITATEAVCAAYPECVLRAYRWDAGDFCPCLVLIDENRTPTTFADWDEAADVTERVQQLAHWGELRVLQLINRRLQELPEELRHCKRMRHLSLVYTDTTTLPEWATEFTELSFFHIEGKPGGRSLLHLPDDLFRDMHKLTSFHLGMHPHLRTLPSFKGLSSLKEATFAYLFAVTELLSFEPLRKLESLQLIYFPALTSIPDMEPLLRLKTLAVYRPMQVCCNGFLGAATCNLTHPFCTENPSASIPRVACLQQEHLRATAATRQRFAENTASVCLDASAVIPEQPTRVTVDICGGVAFRECHMPRVDDPTTLATGICFHTRMQVLACTLDTLKQQMRRRQIQRGVGVPCNPNVEAWLGCV